MYGSGGAKLTMKTIEDCFNVQVDHYVRVNFNSFVQIVDAVGGVDLDITEMEAKALNWEVPSNSMLIVKKVEPGWNHFDGYTALQYARLRAIDDDWHRVARQRTVIQAVLDRIKSASVTELNDLLDTALPVVQTNFTKTEIAALMVQLPSFLGVTADQMTMPVQGTYGVRNGMDDRPMMDPDWAANIAVLQNFLYTDMTAEEAIAAGTATPETADGEETAVPETVEVQSKKNDTVHTYLKDNTTPIYWDYPLEDADFGNADYRVFLAGKTRGQPQNTAMRKALFQYLHEQQGVNVQLVETGVGETQVLEQYLRTGDENWLNHYLKLQGSCADAEAELLAGIDTARPDVANRTVVVLHDGHCVVLQLAALPGQLIQLRLIADAVELGAVSNIVVDAHGEGVRLLEDHAHAAAQVGQLHLL